VAQAFAVRYLAGDARAGWFTANAGFLTAASATMVTGTTVVTVAIGWTAAGAAMCALLATYPENPAARDGVRRTALAFILGDVALWMAVALTTVGAGIVTLGELTDRRADGAVTTAVAVLTVVAALSRSAQIPFHRWLPATLAAPTPVSALLHAGVVNAGGILLLKMSAVTTLPPAAGITVAAGAATMAYGAIIMTLKPDIKGALTFSTTAQMGFMILTCGLGWWAAAVVHLVAHGFYKATLFLGSGSAVARQRRLAAYPPTPPPTGRRGPAMMATAAVLPPAALAVAVQLIWSSQHGAGGYALLLFAWATGTAACWGWLRRRPSVSGILTAALALMPTAVVYVAFVDAVSRYLAPALPPSASPAPWAWATFATALATLAVLAAVRWSLVWPPLHRVVYSRALSAGYVHPIPTGVSR
jgi:NAD(P)H-quinone oxidoreductase subunit 5